MGTHLLYSALSQRGLLDPIKPAYNQSWPDDQLKLTASIFSQYADSPGHSTYCYAELAASFINLLHYCSQSSGFYGAGKDNKGRRTDNPSGCHSIRTIGVLIPQQHKFIIIRNKLLNCL